MQAQSKLTKPMIVQVIDIDCAHNKEFSIGDVMAICVDCGEPCVYPQDQYVVRGELWRLAQMSWASGYLHMACLMTRLGVDELTGDHMLVWWSGRDEVFLAISPDYLNSPEFKLQAS